MEQKCLYLHCKNKLGSLAYELSGENNLNKKFRTHKFRWSFKIERMPFILHCE